VLWRGRGETIVKKVLTQNHGLLIAGAGGLLGIFTGFRISLPFSLFNAILYDFVVLSFFGVVPFLLVRWAHGYLVFYGLGLFLVSLFIFHSFLPATALLLTGLFIYELRREKSSTQP